MSFTIPDFNIQCDIYTGPWIGKTFRLTSDCNLAFGRRNMSFIIDIPVAEAARASEIMCLLLPARTDVRSTLQSGMCDVIEIPRGTGRWYEVYAVDDMARGFDTEYRIAMVTQISEFLDPLLFPGANWPVPMP